MSGSITETYHTHSKVITDASILEKLLKVFARARDIRYRDISEGCR